MVKGKRRSTKGTSIRYSLDRRAGVLLYVQQKRRGRWSTVKVIVVKTAGAGTHRVAFNARAGKKILPAGSCRVIAAAATNGLWSNVRMASFSVVQKKIKPKPKQHRH
jgi:hypothetical protein